ncbi:TIR domain-containing protein [Flavobacterium sp. 140616W15]|uniref:TIR domain-containing protein n=1 Tax=Flavobacterium sp. 140616W15 TaxID=2478552 RepID=UPI000F0C35BC|nr:TIR domain-containing protein [Flavobacterium sp. 140616W15]AYN03086.1 hypothetical protein EAG11_02035 [Flavobacterium sp. 140616W15]
MARETFIAYKYSEAQDLRDLIIKKLGEDATYYKGETRSSPDLTDTSTKNIKENLKNMIFGTSVTIVIVSPKLKDSKWVDWEIEYSLKEYKREDTTSRTNGIVGVVMKVNGSYDWLITHKTNSDGCSSRYIDNSILYNIIKNNRFNLNTENKFACNTCKTYNYLSGSYIALVEEETFLIDPNTYIENAYNKSKNLQKYKPLSKNR